MHISWLGQSTFRIDFKTSGEDGTLLIDPYKHPKEETLRNSSADLVLASRGEDDLITLAKNALVISSAGEYEYKEVLVYGFQTALREGAPLIFRTEIEHVTVAHLGLSNAWFDEKLVNELQGVDILMVSVGGGEGMSSERAVDLITKLEPRVVIPYAFRAEGTGAEFAEVKPFLKALGQEVAPQQKLKIAKKDLPSDQLQVVVLEKQ